MNRIIQYVLLGVDVWLPSISIIILRFIYVLVCINSSFYCWWVSYLDIPKFIYLPVDGHLGYFINRLEVLSTMLLWTFVYRSECGHVLLFFLDRYLVMGLQGHMVGVCLTFKRLPTFSKWLYHFTFLRVPSVPHSY